ncbi:MAG: DUF378 domain-containing protein [Nanoarchaeota archaeon]|nr:DUF378 domain-containing protein [Nanoarchaeota archaeon]
MARKMKWYDQIALLLVGLGAFNWGLVGVFKWNLVEFLLQWFPEVVLSIVYGAVGLAGLYALGYLVYQYVK